jgi:hypothetical protein
MRHAPFVFAVVLTLPLGFSVACTSSTTSTSSSASGSGTSSSSSASTRNGWSRNVSAALKGSPPFAIGEHATLVVADDLSGPPECHQVSGGCDGQPRNECSSPILPNDSTVESITCTAACTATAKTLSPGRIEVEVSATRAGPARVVVTLRDRDGDVREASLDVAFVRATHIGVVRSRGASPHGTKYAALPGASFTWCAGIDAAGTSLTYAPANLRFEVKGAGIAPTETAAPQHFPQCTTFVASDPGEISVDLTYGELTRHETIRVAAPSDVTRMEIFELESPIDGHGDDASIEDDALRGGRIASSIGTDGCHGEVPLVVQRLTLDDGTFGLGPASALTVTPSELVHLLGVGPSPSQAPMVRLQQSERGTGFLRSEIGRASASIPLTVVGDCLPEMRAPEDAGVDTDGASRNDGDAGTP